VDQQTNRSDNQLINPSNQTLTGSDTACASSLDAVGTTARFIQGGLADVAVCGASEGANFEIDFRPALHENQTSFGMVTPTTDPTKACRPFDRDRTGIGR
jgi:3-oxoacyl-(acyl-carrier-protein) synthase